uniref:Uncharacterized protein n=1 Tax=Solanum tuberosum TaxID=4113 RepID=M1DQX7_SOLTU
MECRSSVLPPLTWTQFHDLFLEKYVPRTLRDRRSFNEVTDFVKKVEGVRRDGQAKALAKRDENSGKFQGSYSRGSRRPTLAARPIQSVMPASTISSQVESGVSSSQVEPGVSSEVEVGVSQEELEILHEVDVEEGQEKIEDDEDRQDKNEVDEEGQEKIEDEEERQDKNKAKEGRRT